MSAPTTERLKELPRFFEENRLYNEECLFWAKKGLGEDDNAQAAVFRERCEAFSLAIKIAEAIAANPDGFRNWARLTGFEI